MTVRPTPAIIQAALDHARPYLPEGRVATYIPELGKGDPSQLAIAIMTTDGEVIEGGDVAQTFTLQSISKTISLIMGMDVAGFDEVFSRVGFEPTGDAFNSIVKLETRDKYPLNPMINAGAIAVASCCVAAGATFDDFLNLVRRLCQRETITLNEAVYRSESNAGNRNKSMAYFMQAEKVLACPVDAALEFYFKMCSVDVTVRDLATYGALLAHDGLDPVTGEQVIDSFSTRIVKTQMVMSGMYDASGAFMVNIGIPSKSGVAGGIVSVVDGEMGIGVFSPGLDSQGNSVGGYQLLAYLSEQLNLHMFAAKRA